MTSATLPLVQIAFSVVDLRLTERWFREGFGFEPARGSRALMSSPLAARVQGLPRAASTCWWLVGRNPWFQLELFQFERPVARPLPLDYRPCDIGYSRIGLWVADFDATLARLDGLGTRPVAPAIGANGRRRVFVRSPDGVYVEIMEHDSIGADATHDRTACPVAVRSVTLSVPDLARSVAFFRSLGLETWSGTLDSADREAASGIANARLWTHAFKAGDVIVEVVQYLEPTGSHWPQGYRVSDQGILNIAFGARCKADHLQAYKRAVAAGARGNSKPVHLPGAGVVYVNDADGFSVELLWMKPGKSDRAWGFEPLPIERRPLPDTHSIEASIHVAAPLQRVWQVVSDHEGMSAWSGFDPVVVAWNPPQGYRYRVVKGSPLCWTSR